MSVLMTFALSTITLPPRDRKKAGEIVEIVQNQKDGSQIAPSRSPLKDLSACGEVGDLTAVSDRYGKSDAHLPAFFRSHVEGIEFRSITPKRFGKPLPWEEEMTDIAKARKT